MIKIRNNLTIKWLADVCVSIKMLKQQIRVMCIFSVIMFSLFIDIYLNLSTGQIYIEGKSGFWCEK